jgi:membrane protein implicated in regulation of membrane protease activity
MDFALVAAVFSRRAARFVIPAVFVLHLLVFQVMGVFFPATPLLLLFLDWEALDERLRRPRQPSTVDGHGPA